MVQKHTKKKKKEGRWNEEIRKKGKKERKRDEGLQDRGGRRPWLVL